MHNLNRVSLIGFTGGDAVKPKNNGPTVLSLATNVSWIDEETKERRTRTEWHQLVVWGALGKWAAAQLPKGTPLYVEGELIYEEYPRKLKATLDQKQIEVEATIRAAKIRVQRMIHLDSDNDEGGNA